MLWDIRWHKANSRSRHVGEWVPEVMLSRNYIDFLLFLNFIRDDRSNFSFFSGSHPFCSRLWLFFLPLWSIQFGHRRRRCFRVAILNGNLMSCNQGSLKLILFQRVFCLFAKGETWHKNRTNAGDNLRKRAEETTSEKKKAINSNFAIPFSFLRCSSASLIVPLRFFVGFVSRSRDWNSRKQS